ncbi:MAG: methyltransferase domain-containing protein [Actinomycetota bacterium]
MSTSAATPDDQYTHGHHDAVLRSHRSRTALNSAAYLLPHLRPGQRLLDVGCGPGTITADLAALVAPGDVVAIDRESDVLAEAAAACERAGVDNVTVETGDVYALAYPDDTFDVVHAHQVLQHLSDPVAALAEMKRVCRPGGIVAVRDADYAAMTWYPEEPLLDRWQEVYHAVARGNQAEPDAGRRLLAWANAAGLADIEASASSWCYADDASRRWWGGLWAERLQSSALAEQAIAGGHATPDELAEIAVGFARWQASPDAWFSVLNGEILGRA